MTKRNTKQLILNEAAQLFAKHGYKGASMEDIGNAVSIRPSAIYKHYNGKSDLLVEIVDALAAEFIKTLSPVSEHIVLLQIMWHCSMAGGEAAQLIVDKIIKPLRSRGWTNDLISQLYAEAGKSAISGLQGDDIDWGQDAEYAA